VQREITRLNKKRTDQSRGGNSGKIFRTLKLKSKLVKYGLWTAAIVFTVIAGGYLIVLSSFDIFSDPDIRVLDQRCDYEGLRQAQMYQVEGNAVTNPSIHVSVQLGCSDHQLKNEKLVFTASNGSLQDLDVALDWVTFDTLLIRYQKELQIFTQLDKIEYTDSTLNVYVRYRELE
jgi:hypothetical protein